MQDYQIKSWEDWQEAWKGFAHCQNCGAIVNERVCPVCKVDGKIPPGNIRMNMTLYGKTVHTVFTGAIDYTTYSFLVLMEREWKKGALTSGSSKDDEYPESILIVILFSSLMEGLFNRMFRDALRGVPDPIAEDLLNRYSSIGSKMEKLYRIVFRTNLQEDLRKAEYEHIFSLLKKVQQLRNRFMHGDPKSISRELVIEVIENLQSSQKAWIGIYNRRCLIPEDKRGKDLYFRSSITVGVRL